MENSQLRVLYQETLENITKNPEQLRAFLTQNSYLHQLPFEEIVQIHGQNQRATLLKTWTEWQALGSVPLKGQAALQSLKEFNNRYSKRNSYFDITQLAHQEIEIETLSLSSEQVETYLSLNKWNFNHAQDTLTNYLDFLKNVSETTLLNFDFLNQNEKQIVPLVAQYNLIRAYNLATDKHLMDINNEVFKALQQDSIRIDRVIKIGNNLSTKQVELISEQIDQINHAAQSLLEENYKKELEKFETGSTVEPVIEDELPAFNPEQIWAMKEIIPTFYSDFPSETTDEELVVLAEKMRNALVIDENLKQSAMANSYQDFEFTLSDSIGAYLLEHHADNKALFNFLLNHQPIDFPRVIGKQIYERFNNSEHITADELLEPIEEVPIQAEEVPTNQELVKSNEEYQQIIERGYTHLHDSYMHYQDLKLEGLNVSGAYDTFDFETTQGSVQLGYNYIGRELGTDDDSKVVFWVSTDLDAYSTDPMSTPIRSRVFQTFEEAGQALNFENVPLQNIEAVEEIEALEKNSQKATLDRVEILDVTPDISNSQIDERALLEKIKNDFNLNEDYTIYENEWEIALQKVSFGGVLNEFVIKFEDGELVISDVADSITNIKNFTTEVEKTIENFRTGVDEPTLSNNDEIIVEDVLEENIDQEQIIAEVLLRSSNIAEGNFRIQHYFEVHSSLEPGFKKYGSAFLAKEYGTGGYSSKELSYDNDSKGLKIIRPIELTLSWSNVAERVSNFVQEGTYLTGNIINDYQEWLLDEATVNFAESRWPQIIEEKEKQEAAGENGEIDLFDSPDSIETDLENNTENKIHEITQLSDEELQEQIIDSYGKMIGAEGNGYSPNSFNRWSELREEENRRRSLNEPKEINLFDEIEVETESEIPTNKQLDQADTILAEMLDEVEQRKPQILSEWSGGLQRLKLYEINGQSREELLSLDLQTGQFIPEETLLDQWTVAQRERLRQRLSEVMAIPYEASPQLELEAPLNNEPLVDFEFPEDLSEFYPKTPTEKVNANIEAIQLVKQIEIEIENRGATPAEQTRLAKYVGWGGLANEFFDENRLKFAAQRQELKALVSDEEYQAMRESSLTAYYTDPLIIQNMYRELEENGFQGGRILDPAMGTGNFFSAMPQHLREKSELYGVELDTITGSIAKLLHPHATIKVQGFETIDFNAESFDVVVGNVPFANFTINDSHFGKPYLIHDYFFKKSLHLVRPGGLVSFITSTGTMDKRNASFRKELHQEAGLVGAIRLPNTAFKAIAGTDVATDILTLQKGQTRSIGFWEETKNVRNSNGELIEGVLANEFFSKEDSLAVIGSFEVKNFNGKTLSVRLNANSDLIAEMDKARAFHHRLIPDIATYYSERALSLTSLPPAETQKIADSTPLALPKEVQKLAPQTHMVYENKVYFHDPDDGIIEKNEAWYKSGYLQLFDEFDNPKLDKDGKPVMGNTRGKYDGKTLARLKGLTQISKRVEAIVNYQIENPVTEAEDVQFEYLLKALNQTYDAFVNDKKLALKNGNSINNPKNTKIFEDDLNFYRMLSIENEVKNEDGTISYEKGDFFFKKTIAPATQLPQITNVNEGLDLSINLYGRVNLDFIGEQLSMATDEVIADLGEAVYLNPQTEIYETASEYLSGNLKEKLVALDNVVAHGGDVSAYSPNMTALENALPPRLSINEIEFQIGTRWIPIEVYQAFLREKLNNGYNVDMEIEHNSITDSYHITKPTLNNRAAPYKLSPLYKELQITGKSSHNNPIHLFEDLLNLKNTKVMDSVEMEDGKKKSVVNPDLTIVAREKQQVLQNAFHEFVNQNVDTVKALETLYNDRFNSTVVREFDGSNLTFDHLSPNIVPRPHQKNAVSRVIQEKRGLLDHVVGSGKTITMVLAGRKLKQLGFSKKPCYVVPKAVLNQFAAEALRTYPDLKIIVPTEREFSVSNRKRFMAKVQTGNYDAVFLSTEQFGKIPLTKEREEEIIQAEIAEIIAVKNAAKAEDKSKPTIKQLIKLEKNAKERLEKLQTRKDETAINFESTGIDFLFVDEAHLFKNLSFQTNITDVKGINIAASKRASDMLGKIRYLQEIHDGGGVVFATGTPISNSMAEMYTMMKYLMPDILQREGISNFDSWASTFGEIETKMEVDQTGQKWKSVSRFAKFHNVTELLTLYGQVADTQTQEMLDLPVPKIANEGKPFIHASEMTEAQAAYMEQLIYRSENMPNDPSIDNSLKLTTDARLMATDMRLIDESLYDKNDSLKSQQVAETVYDIWQRTTENRSTQLIFSDIGTPKGKRKSKEDTLSADDFDYKFSVYGDIRERLENFGIPSHEIAFIHDYPTDKQRATLFEKVRKGEIRVLFASTQKGGTGVNIQDRLIAVHHVDAPWKPSDIEQRNGRIIRQGNLNPAVEIHHYVTTGTFDTFMWQKQEQKLTYINQIRSRKSKSRTVEDLDELVLNASEIKAIATKNPFIREKMDLENQLVKLSILRNNFYSGMNADKLEIQRLEAMLPAVEKYYEKALVDSSVASKFQSMDAENFSLFLDGHFFTDKSKAGEYIAQKAYQSSDTTSLGEYGGFELMVKPNVNTDIMAEPTIYLVGQNSYSTKVNPSSGSGTMIRIDHLLKRAIIKTTKNQGEQIEGMKIQIEQLKTKENLTFEKEEEYQETTQRLAHINAEIELSLEPTVNNAPEEIAIKNVEPLEIEPEFEM